MTDLTIVTGKVWEDAVLRTTKGGQNVLGFNVGVSQGKDKDGNWRKSKTYKCSMWGERGAKLAQYITAGSIVELTGRVDVEVYEGKGSLRLDVNTFEFAPKQSDNQGSQGGSYGAPAGGADTSTMPNDFDDDIPFAPEWRA